MRPSAGMTPAEREHRRQHRVGRPPKIDGDPDVRAFIQAHIDELTFDRLAAKAKAAFGPRRAPSRSSIHRWWRSQQRRDAEDSCPWCQRPLTRPQRLSRRKQH
jgi:hypothetical protein